MLRSRGGGEGSPKGGAARRAEERRVESSISSRPAWGGGWMFGMVRPLPRAQTLRINAHKRQRSRCMWQRRQRQRSAVSAKCCKHTSGQCGSHQLTLPRAYCPFPLHVSPEALRSLRSWSASLTSRCDLAG